MTAKSYKAWDVNDNLMRNGWRLASIGQLVKKSNEWVEIEPTQTYKEITVRLWGRGVALRGKKSGSEIGTTKRLRVHRGQFIFSRIDARNGAFGIIPDELEGAVVSTDFPVHNTKMDLLLPDYLDWLSRVPSFIDACRAVSEGTTNRVRLKEDKFYKIEIPLPPISEQRRIVAKIERLAAKIEEVKGLRKTLQHRLKSFLSSVVEKRCSNPIYKVIKFGNVLDSATNGIYKPPEFWGRGLPCVRMYNIEGPEMNTRDIQHLDITDEELKKFGCVEGDLIFNRVNSAELVGKTGLITATYPRCTFESKNMRLRVDKSKVVPAYAAVVLNSSTVKRYYREQLKQQCGMATLNQQHVRGIPFPLPSIHQQIGIAEELDGLQTKVNRLKALQTKTAAEFDAMLPSILDKAFKGEL